MPIATCLSGDRRRCGQLSATGGNTVADPKLLRSLQGLVVESVNSTAREKQRADQSKGHSSP